MHAINCGTDTAPKWYLPEKLQILPYQIHKRKIPDALTSEMLDNALHHPDTTRALIEHEGLGKLGLKPGESLKPFVSQFRYCLKQLTDPDSLLSQLSRLTQECCKSQPPP